MIALFFSTDVSYVIRELKEREELRRFAGVVDVPSEQQIYELLARFSNEQFINCVLRIKKLFQRLKALFKYKIQKWWEYKPIRNIILSMTSSN